MQRKFVKMKKKGSFLLVDINDEKQVNETISLIIKKYRKIDCLINAASFTGQDMLETNVNFFENSMS